MIQNKEIINFKNFTIGVNKKILFLILIFLFSATNVFAVNSSGFISEKVWYTGDLKEGNTVKIYTAIWNDNEYPLSAKIEFYNKNVILGSRDIVINPLSLEDVSMPWKVIRGDHIISAKVVSSFLMISSGEKEKIVLNKNLTIGDKVSINVSIKNENGDSILDSNIIKNQIDKTNLTINSNIPENIKSLYSRVFLLTENFRVKSFNKMIESKKVTQEEIDLIKNNKNKTNNSLNEKNNIEETIKQPVAYLRLILLSILIFIFSSKLFFYILFFLLIFYILRFIYRKIKYS